MPEYALGEITAVTQLPFADRVERAKLTIEELMASNRRTRIAERLGDRRRLTAALTRRFTGEVPFMEIYVAEKIVDKVMDRPMGTHMLKLPAEDYVEFLLRTGMDAAYLYEGWSLGRRNKIHADGRVDYIDGTIKSRRNFDQIVRPSLDGPRRRIESYLKAAEGTNLGTIYGVDTSPAIMATAMGPMDHLVAMYDDAGFIEEFLDLVEEYTLPLAECVSQYSVDAFMVPGVECMKTGPLVSPEMHERFIFPRLKKVLEILRPTGKPIILHSDGDNSMFMDRIIELGFSALHPIEPCSPSFDIYSLKEQFNNRLCLCGNIDVADVLSRGSPDEVAADVLEHLDRLSPGGGYVCGSSHDITENIPFENFCAMARTICSYKIPGEALFNEQERFEHDFWSLEPGRSRKEIL